MELTKAFMCALLRVSGPTYDRIMAELGRKVPPSERGEITDEMWRSTVLELSDALFYANGGKDSKPRKQRKPRKGSPRRG